MRDLIGVPLRCRDFVPVEIRLTTPFPGIGFEKSHQEDLAWGSRSASARFLPRLLRDDQESVIKREFKAHITGNFSQLFKACINDLSGSLL